MGIVTVSHVTVNLFVLVIVGSLGLLEFFAREKQIDFVAFVRTHHLFCEALVLEFTVLLKEKIIHKVNKNKSILILIINCIPYIILYKMKKIKSIQPYRRTIFSWWTFVTSPSLLENILTVNEHCNIRLLSSW